MSNNYHYKHLLSQEDSNTLNKISYIPSVCDINFSNLIVKKPWGYEYLLFENEFCALWILKIDYMENTSMHCHTRKDTTLICIDETVQCNTLTKKYILNKLDSIYFEKNSFHQTQSISQKGSVVLEIETPVNKFDLVRILDNYGRQGREYENKENYECIANLTFDICKNNFKKINDTHIEIVKLNDVALLTNYPQSSIFYILSNSENIVYTICDISKQENLIDKLLLIIYTKDNE